MQEEKDKISKIFVSRPDISALRERGVLGANPATTMLSVNPSLNPYQGPALQDLEAPKRQTSLDGEAIKIVIHDVDSGQVTAAKRRVILRRDPNEKAHRSKSIYQSLFNYTLNCFYFSSWVWNASCWWKDGSGWKAFCGSYNSILFQNLIEKFQKILKSCTI